MRGLLLQLSSLDADAENAVRVIGFFDALLTGKADLNNLLKSTAALAECPVGISSPARGLLLRAAPNGTIDLATPPPTAQFRDSAGAPRADADPADTTFWLARAGAPLPLDEIVLERFALTGAILLNSTVTSLPSVGDPALIELTVSPSAGLAERCRALHLLGLSPTAPLRVTVTTPAAAADLATTALIGEYQVSLVGADHAVDATEGMLVGVGPAVSGIEAPESWRQARTACRLASPEEPVKRADELGGLLALAERLRPEDIDASPDVQALDRIAAEPTGDDLLRLLRAFAVADSVRKAAALIYRHHSTVAHHLQHTSTVLGFELDTPTGRFRLNLALAMRALR